MIIMPGFWRYQGCEYARVTQGSEYAWTITGYAWLCLNMPISVWMAFVLHLPIVNPSLKKESQTVFLKSKNLIFYSSCKYFILFFVLDCIFLQVRFQICCYLWGPTGPVYPMIYPINISDAFLIIYSSILLLLFFHFLELQRT